MEEAGIGLLKLLMAPSVPSWTCTGPGMAGHSRLVGGASAGSQRALVGPAARSLRISSPTQLGIAATP